VFQRSESIKNHVLVHNKKRGCKLGALWGTLWGTLWGSLVTLMFKETQTASTTTATMLEPLDLSTTAEVGTRISKIQL